MHTTLPSDKKLWPEARLISARWWYAPLAFLLSMIARDAATPKEAVPILIAAFFIVLFGNVWFSFFLRKAASPDAFLKWRTLFNGSQIALDLAFFSLVLVFSGGIYGISHVFFLVPVIAAIALFGFRGGIIVAALSGLLVLFSTLLTNGFFAFSFLGVATAQTNHTLLFALGESSVLAALYVLAGFFGGSVLRLFERRDLLLQGEIAKGQEQVKRLEKLTDEFDQSAKLLVRRDIELTSANEKLTQLDRMKSEIISIVAHQLRTPLSAIKWTLKMLLDEDTGKVTDEQKGLLAKGFESNERMVTLINDMLAVDHLESGKLKYNFIPVQFESLVEEMVNNLLPIATHKRIVVEFSAPQDPLPKVKVDPDKMRDVLQNLIDNAIKYSKEGSTVTVGAEMGEEAIHFWVKDGGIGIPDDAKGKIFSRFFRAANAVSTETDGSGLGLFIAQSVVKRHGGKIWFESVVNEGATFHVTLPLTP
ncbi:MAG: ATP-binding protein [bacterium]|nr:ATP-binding protein [bacterium]